jgi:NADH:ubiquinone oxidoreductase subunit 2 (subunit N)
VEAAAAAFVAGVIVMWFTTVAPDHARRRRAGIFAGAFRDAGIPLMASTSNLLMLFLAVEMASLPSYVLAGFRKMHRIAPRRRSSTSSSARPPARSWPTG